MKIFSLEWYFFYMFVLEMILIIITKLIYKVKPDFIKKMIRLITSLSLPTIAILSVVSIFLKGHIYQSSHNVLYSNMVMITIITIILISLLPFMFVIDNKSK